ncbi:hypothetical protein BDK51DRAFT_37007 [Blyttiomyces helicus]|uniref:Uncharacterized protein n=1 Tax=Blyttiomyces helicus TaxID=388810 RepID=A0A4P9W6N9_9FUNG|nr:hypothetical protein BDK51DRAFT_37007 [Blyttiomyces helicus]|eukprot:RKO87672.1 hypothetical protein BDK51DRAFT_37007 [Blyttiomyces helicus]
MTTPKIQEKRTTMSASALPAFAAPFFPGFYWNHPNPLQHLFWRADLPIACIIEKRGALRSYGGADLPAHPARSWHTRNVVLLNFLEAAHSQPWGVPHQPALNMLTELKKRSRKKIEEEEAVERQRHQRDNAAPLPDASPHGIAQIKASPWKRIHLSSEVSFNPHRWRSPDDPLVDDNEALVVTRSRYHPYCLRSKTCRIIDHLEYGGAWVGVAASSNGHPVTSVQISKNHLEARCSPLQQR